MGNRDLTFSVNPSYTAGFSENSSDASLCTASTSLGPGEACDVSVLFTPQSAGSLSTSVIVTNNHLNASAATQSVAVSGTGTTTQPSIELVSSANPALVSSSVTLKGAVATNVTVTVLVPANVAVVRRSNTWTLGIALPLLGMLALPFGIERRRRSFKQALGAVLLLAGMASTAAILGCGGSTHTPTTPPTQPTNYTITVTAASGSVSHSTTLTLTVH